MPMQPVHKKSFSPENADAWGGVPKLEQETGRNRKKLEKKVNLAPLWTAPLEKSEKHPCIFGELFNF